MSVLCNRCAGGNDQAAIFRAVAKELAVPVQAQSAPAKLTNTKGPSKADKPTADKVPSQAAARL